MIERGKGSEFLVPFGDETLALSQTIAHEIVDIDIQLTLHVGKEGIDSLAWLDRVKTKVQSMNNTLTTTCAFCADTDKTKVGIDIRYLEVTLDTITTMHTDMLRILQRLPYTRSFTYYSPQKVQQVSILIANRFHSLLAEIEYFTSNYKASLPHEMTDQLHITAELLDKVYTETFNDLTLISNLVTGGPLKTTDVTGYNIANLSPLSQTKTNCLKLSGHTLRCELKIVTPEFYPVTSFISLRMDNKKIGQSAKIYSYMNKYFERNPVTPTKFDVLSKDCQDGLNGNDLEKVINNCPTHETSTDYDITPKALIVYHKIKVHFADDTERKNIITAVPTIIMSTKKLVIRNDLETVFISLLSMEDSIKNLTLPIKDQHKIVISYEVSIYDLCIGGATTLLISLILTLVFRRVCRNKNDRTSHTDPRERARALTELEVFSRELRRLHGTS